MSFVRDNNLDRILVTVDVPDLEKVEPLDVHLFAKLIETMRSRDLVGVLGGVHANYKYERFLLEETARTPGYLHLVLEGPQTDPEPAAWKQPK